MKYITFGKISAFLIYPFCAPIFFILRYLILIIANKHNQSHCSVISAFSSSSVLLCFYKYIGEALNGLFLIKNCIKKSKDKLIQAKRNKLQTKGRFSLITYENKKKPYIIALLVLLFGIINCANTIFLLEIGKANPALVTLQNFQIIFTIILSYLLLHIIWYRHQILSSFFVVIGSIICFYILYRKFYHENSLYLLIMFIILIFLALQEVLEKAVFLLGMSPNELLLYEGICSIVLCLLNSTGSSIIYHCNPSLLKYFQRNSFSTFSRLNWLIFIDSTNILLLLAYIVLNMLYSYFIKYSNYHFTPMSRAISDTISIFITNLIKNTQDEKLDSLDITFVVFGFAFILIGCILYNEIIIIQCSGFATNTKQEIIKRGSKESVKLMQEKEDLNVSLNSDDYNDNMEIYSTANTHSDN